MENIPNKQFNKIEFIKKIDPDVNVINNQLAKLFNDLNVNLTDEKLITYSGLIDAEPGWLTSITWYNMDHEFGLSANIATVVFKTPQDNLPVRYLLRMQKEEMIMQKFSQLNGKNKIVSVNDPQELGIIYDFINRTVFTKES